MRRAVVIAIAIAAAAAATACGSREAPPAFNEQLLERYQAGTPTVIFFDADGNELGRFHEFVKPKAFMKVLGPAARTIQASRKPAPAAAATMPVLAPSP